jgi:hypothetical protein
MVAHINNYRLTTMYHVPIASVALLTVNCKLEKIKNCLILDTENSQSCCCIIIHVSLLVTNVI